MAPATEPDDAEAQRTLAAVWVANFLAAVGMMSFLPFFPSYLRTLGVAEVDLGLWAGLCVGAAPLGAAIMGPVWGALGDRFGRKPMVLRALFSLTLFVGLMPFASTPLQLLVLRLGQGVFSGFLPPSITLVAAAYPSGRQGRIAGALQSAMAGGAIVGPLFGSLFREHFPPRLLFFATAALTACAGLAVLRFAREVERPVWTPLSGSRRGVLAPLRLALELLVDLTRRLARLVRTPRVGAALLFVFAAQFGVGATSPQLELFVGQLEPGWGVVEVTRATGWLFSAVAITGVLTMSPWGRLGDRTGHGRVLLGGAFVAGLALVLNGVAGAFWHLLASRVVLGVFASAFGPAAFGIVGEVTPREEQGAANGAVFSARAFAMAFSAMGGGALARVVGLRGVFVGGGLLLVVLAVLAAPSLGRRSGSGGSAPDGQSTA